MAKGGQQDKVGKLQYRVWKILNMSLLAIFDKHSVKLSEVAVIYTNTNNLSVCNTELVKKFKNVTSFEHKNEN